MAFRTLVNNFTAGELDPRFLAMVDYAGYHKGCREFKNVFCSTKGGCTRRFGTYYTDVIVNRKTGATAYITDEDEVRVVPYEYNASEKYDIIIRPDSTANKVIAFDVYLGDVFIDTFYPPDNTYTVAQIRELRWAAATDRIIFFHPDVNPHQMIRTAYNAWTISEIILIRYPTFDYTPYDNPTVPYTASTETYASNVTTGSGTFSRSAGTSTPFTDNHVGGIIQGNGGLARITGITSNTSVNITTITDFDSTSAVPGQDIQIREKAWGNGSTVVVQGAARGWPAHGTFFQGRMYVGNWKSIPGMGSASKVNSIFNFDDSGSDPDDAFSFEVGKDGNDVIQDIIGYKSMTTLGVKGPSSTSILLAEPITPTNMFMNPQGTEGAANIDGKIVNNQILYPDSTSTKIYSMGFDVPDTGYSIIDVSSLSSHMLTDIRWAEIYDPPERDGKYYVAINEDGTLATLLMVQEENIKSWSQSYTLGNFIDVAAPGDECKLLVKRQVSTSSIAGTADKVYSVEQTFNVFTDVTADIDTPSNVTFFSQDESYIVIGNEIQFTKITLTFATPANADLGLVFEFLDLNGDWITFTPTDGTTGFSGNGDITWDYTDVNSWMSQTLNSVKRKYWIRIRRTEPGVIDRAFTVDTTFTSFTDVTSSLSSASSDATLFAANGDYLVIGYSEAFDILNVDLDTNASSDIAATFEYLDSSGAWITFSPTDGTTGFTGSGAISWTASALTDWAAKTVNSIPLKYWIRIRRTETTVATPPIENTIFLNITTAPSVSLLRINTGTRIYRESMSFNNYMDCQIDATADASGDLTGLGALAGQKCFVFGDNFPIGSYIVADDGTLSLGIAYASMDISIGLDFKPIVVPMPAVAFLQNGYNTYNKQHILEAYIDYYESLGIMANGQNINGIEGTSYSQVAAPVPETGFYEIPVHKGWEPRQELVITQSYPAPFTLLGIGITVEVT